jgi:hypothetical protein
MIPACGHERIENTQPDPCYLSGKPDRSALRRDVLVTAYMNPYADFSESIPGDTCIPNVCGLNYLQLPWKLLRLFILSGSIPGKLHYFPETIKSCESRGKAGVYLNEIIATIIT